MISSLRLLYLVVIAPKYICIIHPVWGFHERTMCKCGRDARRAGKTSNGVAVARGRVCVCVCTRLGGCGKAVKGNVRVTRA